MWRLMKPSGRRSHHRTGVRIDHWPDSLVFPSQPKTGELSGTESQRGFQRRAPKTGAISKQGNTMLRWLLVEAGQKAARSDPALAARLSTVKNSEEDARWPRWPSRASWLCVCNWMLRSGADYDGWFAGKAARGGHPGGRKYTAILIGRLAPASDRGV